MVRSRKWRSMGLSPDHADYLNLDANEILVSGAAVHDVIFGTNDDAYDLLLGWGGSDWMQGYGGENMLIGGRAAIGLLLII